MQVFAQRVYWIKYDPGGIAAIPGIVAATHTLTQLRADLGSLATGLVEVIVSLSLLGGRDFRAHIQPVRTRHNERCEMNRGAA